MSCGWPSGGAGRIRRGGKTCARAPREMQAGRPRGFDGRKVSGRWFRSRALPPPSLFHHPLDDRFDMSGCAIDGRKSGIGFAEDEIEVCAGENDSFNAIASAEGLGYLA